MELKWEDTTSRSRGEAVGEPRSYELRTRHIRVTVHRLHGLSPDLWFASCHDVGIKDRELRAKAPDDAKIEAIDIVRGRLLRMIDDLAGRL